MIACAPHLVIGLLVTGAVVGLLVALGARTPTRPEDDS